MTNGVPSLPQRSADPDARRRLIERQLSKYAYATPTENPLAPIAVAGKFPFSERYSLDWALPYLPQFIRTFVDTQANKIWFGLYMHANHHKRANIFNPAKMDEVLARRQARAWAEH